ncbi:MAG: endo-1,4-beta-xylanase [Kiritimatiellae bacterium]|nr:endo-1,4-beta-xylanase [Kiritimatiellia bacterium]
MGLIVFAGISNSQAEVAKPETLVSSDDYLMRESYGSNMSFHEDGNGKYKKYIRVVTDQNYGVFYMVQLIKPVAADISKGDVLMIKFAVRNAGAMPGSITAYFQQNYPNYSKDICNTTFVDGEHWKEYSFPFVASQDYSMNKGSLCFGFGFSTQQVDIAGVQLLRYPKGTDIKKLESTPLKMSYIYKKDAPWKKSAQERIEQYRMGDFEISVVDKKGKPVKGAGIVLNMKKHEFLFGSIFSTKWIVDESKDGIIYKEKILELFNATGTENSLKWPCWAGGNWNTDQAGTLKSIKWAVDNGLFFRGHVLVWPSWKHVSKALQQYKDNPEKIREECEKHIVDIVSATKQYFNEWDVLNEPRANNDLMQVCGDDIMVDWYKTAKKTNPDAVLYINEYSILATSGVNTKEHQKYKETIKYLIDNGAPVDGIGMQCHFGNNYLDMPTIKAILDDFAKLGLDIKITEFDVNTKDEKGQAEFTEDFMTMIFSHPAVKEFQMWGFWEGSHWRGDCAFYTKDWREKLNARTYKKLVFDKWWTNRTLTTTKDGKADLKAFYGKYKIFVSYDGREVVKDVIISKDNKKIVIEI